MRLWLRLLVWLEPPGGGGEGADLRWRGKKNKIKINPGKLKRELRADAEDGPIRPQEDIVTKVGGFFFLLSVLRTPPRLLGSPVIPSCRSQTWRC